MVSVDTVPENCCPRNTDFFAISSTMLLVYVEAAIASGTRKLKLPSDLNDEGIEAIPTLTATVYVPLAVSRLSVKYADGTEDD